MKLMKKMLVLLLVLVLFASAAAEEIYLDKSERDLSLFEDYVCTYDDYFTFAFPVGWRLAVLAEEDLANGLLEVGADDLENPGMKVTICKYSPEECEEIFGGAGYDAIFAAVSNAYEPVYSAKINNVWTVAYGLTKEDHRSYVLDFTTTDYLMYQIRFDIYNEDFVAVMNSMIMSLEGI